MKKILAITLALMLVVTGCGGGAGKEDADGKLKIGYLINNMNDTFQTYIAEAAQEKAKELGYAIEVQDAQEDVIRQQDQVNAMIGQGIDALIVVPVDTSAMDPITKAAEDAGIPLVYVNRNPFASIDESEIPEDTFYVGSQEKLVGQLQAEYLIDTIGEEAGVGILMGILSNEGAVQRTEGNKDILKDYPGVKILAEESAEWQKDQGMNIAENWLTAHGDKLTAILSNNDEMAIGAINAVKDAGRDDVFIIGVDAIPDALDLIEKGDMAGSVRQDPNGQGMGAVEIVDRALNDVEQDPVQWVELVLITEENVEDFK